MDEGSLYVLARREAGRIRQAAWLHASWPRPLLGERPTLPERLSGIPDGTVYGSDFVRRPGSGSFRAAER